MSGPSLIAFYTKESSIQSNVSLQEGSITQCEKSPTSETQRQNKSVIENSNKIDQTEKRTKPITISDATKIRIENPHNAMIGYLNVNHLRNKVSDIKHLTDSLFPTVLAIGETKLDTSFPNANFLLSDYFSTLDYRKDRSRYGGGLLIYIRKGTPCKRLKDFEEPGIESICFEMSVNKQKWIIFSVYRPPNDQNLHQYFDYLSKMADKGLNKYENLIIMGDINIDIERDTGLKIELLKNLCDSFSFRNLIKAKTCFTKTSESSLDVILTNKPRSFFHSLSVETGSDVHTMVCTMMRSHTTRLKPIKIQYRNYKYYNEETFHRELASLDLISDETDPDKMYSSFIQNFADVFNRHAPLKSKYIRGNNAPFMNKELGKAIMKRSMLRNAFNKNKNDHNWKLFSRQRNLCNKIKRKAKRSYFHKLSKNPEPKEFWSIVKPYISDKGIKTNEDYMLEENNTIFRDEKKIANIFNDLFVNIIERTTGKKIDTSSKNESIENIILKYKDHPSIKLIKSIHSGITFSMPLAKVGNIKKILSTLDPKKGPGSDKIPPKIVIRSAKILCKPFTQIINATITQHEFPENAKLTRVTPIYKNPKMAQD